MYDTTYVDDTLMNVCNNDIDCQISSMQSPSIWGAWSLLDSHIFGICFTLSFMVTISIFFLMVMNNIIHILLTLIRKIDKLSFNSFRKGEALYRIGHASTSYENTKCILKNCDNTTAEYIYVSTKSKPFTIVYFCEKHAHENCANIPIIEDPIPEFL